MESTQTADVGRLLAEILADPASEAARLVFADHLIEQGDPRGELVQLQCKLENIEWDDPQRRVLDERIADLLARHETAWTRDVRALGFDDHLQQVSLRRGFVERVTIDAKDTARLVPALRAITPLRELHVSARDDKHVDDVGAAACELEALSIRPDRGEVARRIADALPHWPHRGKLQTLHVSGPAAAHAIATTPALRGLKRLRVDSIDPRSMVALASAKHLESVDTLEIPNSSMGGEGLTALANSTCFTALRRLQMEQAGITLAAFESFASSSIARALNQLRIHHNHLGERGALALASHFTALELLDVERTELRGGGVRALLGATKLGKLASLDLSRNSLGDAELARAVDALEVTSLRHLACLENFLEAGAAAAIARSRLDELRSLDLSSNLLGDAGVIALAEASRLGKLGVLRIRSTGVGARGLGVLGASALGARLRSIDIARNDVDDRGLEALLASRLPALEALDLGGSALTIRGIEALIASPIAAHLRHLTLTGLDAGALAPFFAAEFPQLRSLVADRFDDDAARGFAAARGLPALHSIAFHAKELTDAGARVLADSSRLQRVLWFELDAPKVTQTGRAMLRDRFGHHVAVFSGATLHAFSVMGRRI